MKGSACLWSWVPHLHAACASFPATFLWVSENLKSLLWALALCIRLLLAGLLLLLYSSLPCCYEAARGCARASAREAGLPRPEACRICGTHEHARPFTKSKKAHAAIQSSLAIFFYLNRTGATSQRPDQTTRKQQRGRPVA